MAVEMMKLYIGNEEKLVRWKRGDCYAAEPLTSGGDPSYIAEASAAADSIAI